jgi:hypothetical protein
MRDEGYNYLVPRVRDEILALTTEIADRYAGYPAIKGLTWMRTPEFRGEAVGTVGTAPLDVGYGDITIAQFTNDTGISVPKHVGDPNRFGKRRAWLLSHYKNEWVQWRASKVYDLDSTILETLKSRRPDWDLWRISNIPTMKQLLQWDHGESTYNDVYLQQGIDPALYGKPGGPKLIRMYDLTGPRIFLDQRGRADLYAIGKRWNALSQWIQPNCAGVFIHMGFSIEKYLHAEGSWEWNRLHVVGNSVPLEWGKRLGERFAGTFTCSPVAVPIGWSDSGHVIGQEREIRNFIRTLAERPRQHNNEVKR